MTFHTGRQKPAAGASSRDGRIAVCFGQSLFERIAGEAARRRLPFAAVVRERLIASYRGEANQKPPHREGER